MPLSNRFLLFLLNKAQASTRAWWLSPLHELARMSYLNAFTPLLEEYLRRRLGDRSWRLVCRHSATRGGDFNVFLSDVDYTFVLEPEFDEERNLRRLVDLYEEAHASLPFMGELQIYDAVEWELKQRLIGSHGDAIEMVWNLRKIGWQEAKFKTSTSAYHDAKCLRSIQRLLDRYSPGLTASRAGNLRKLGPAISKRIESWFPEAVVPDDGEFDWTPGYLGWRLTSKSIDQPLALVLTARACRLFAAILPDAEPSMTALRAQDTIRKAYLAVTATEYLLIHSVTRLEGRLPATAPAWLRVLDADLEKNDLAREVIDVTRRFAARIDL